MEGRLKRHSLRQKRDTKIKANKQTEITERSRQWLEESKTNSRTKEIIEMINSQQKMRNV